MLTEIMSDTESRQDRRENSSSVQSEMRCMTKDFEPQMLDVTRMVKYEVCSKIIANLVFIQKLFMFS